MQNMMIMLVLGVVVGMILLALNPSPFFGSFNLVMLALLICGILILHGGSFLSLVLLMIYLGGMLVVFVYSSALSADKNPEMPKSISFIFGLGLYVFFVMSIWWEGMSRGLEGWWEYSVSGELEWGAVIPDDMEGVSVMYCLGGGLLLIGAWALLMALLVVLELVRGLGRGGLRVS